MVLFCIFQMEKAKNHYNGKKQQLLEANEKVHAIAKALETSEQEAKTLKEQMKVLQLELEQANGLQKDLILKVNSLQAQVSTCKLHTITIAYVLTCTNMHLFL